MITDELRGRYLNDAVFHALVHRVLQATEVDGFAYTFNDIRAAVDVAEYLKESRRSKPREHEWEFYANGSFCKRCGASIGSGVPCR